MTSSFQLQDAIPWGRNRAEYLAFFDLDADALPPRILDCAAGPSSFTAEMAALGHDVVATDPLYAFSQEAITAEIAAARPLIMAGVRQSAARFRWDDYGSPEGLEATRSAAMTFFLKDYEAGQTAGRYVAATLPNLPFAEGAFDLVLCSHFLFLYSDQFDLAFHLAALQEMLRTGQEVRVFPLLDMQGEKSAHLTPLLAALRDSGTSAEVQPVAYEFQVGGNEMLRVRTPTP